MSKLSDTLVQTIKYLFAGGSAALVELALFWVLQQAQWSIVYANLTAIACSTLYNFFFNKKVTFKSDGNLLRSSVLYVVLLAFNSAFSTIFISGMSEGFGLNTTVAKVLAMCCTVSWNYVLYRKVIFK